MALARKSLDILEPLQLHLAWEDAIERYKPLI
jgi:hypothetical protein